MNNQTMTLLDLNNKIRTLWFEHILWTKIVIAAIATNAPDKDLVTNRLLKNATDFRDLFAIFYNPMIAQQFGNLMREHLVIAADLVVAAKNQDSKINEIERNWYRNADDIARFLSRINPNWNETAVRNMLYNHLALTKAETVSILTNKYADSITLFDEIEKQALMMADTFTSGLVRQFHNGIENN